MTSPCLDDAALDDFVHARLSGEARVATEAHLDGCPECSAIVSVLAGGGLSSKDADEAALERGATVGRHVVIEPLGKGAMGVVYLAFDPELDRKVALKLVRSRASPEAQRRMLREAQAMAQIASPNVVAIYDVGRSGADVYLAMEFVEGKTLREWSADVSWTERLDALVQAGRGLAAAHAAGLVHRDFKPENVLVGRDGRVRVTDFGLARMESGSALVDPSTPLTPEASLTRTGALLGTPSYMAPEVLDGKEASTASDQFSFGVALYEAAAGSRPFVASTIAELRAAIARGPGAIVPGPAAVRRVLTRALSARPEDRYPSMQALLADLAPRPSRPRSWMIASLLAVAVVTATAGWAWSHRMPAPSGAANRCATGKVMAARALDDDRSARIRAAFASTGLLHAPGAVEHVLAQLRAYAEEWAVAHRATCEATEVRREQSPALLDARMHCLGRRLDELDALAGRLEHATPEIVAQGAEAAASLPRIDACADVTSLQSLAPRPSGELGKKLDALESRLAVVRAGASSGAAPAVVVDVARSLVADADAIGYRPALAETRLLLATLLRRSGAFGDATGEANQALIAAETSHDDRSAALAWLELLAIRGEEGSAPAVIASAAPATAAVGRLGRAVDLEASVLFELGVARTSTGDLVGARRDLEACLERRKSVLPERHLDIARTLTALGNVARARGELDRAMALHREALAMDSAMLGPSHPAVARHHHNIAGVLRLQGKLEEALQHYEHALGLEVQGFGPRHLTVGRTENSIGLIGLARKDSRTAREHFTKALDILESHPDRGLVLHNLGLADAMDGRHADALRRFDAALIVLRAAHAEPHPSVVAVVESRARSQAALVGGPPSRPPPSQATSPLPTAPPPSSSRVPGSYAPAETWDTHH